MEAEAIAELKKLSSNTKKLLAESPRRCRILSEGIGESMPCVEASYLEKVPVYSLLNIQKLSPIP